MLSLLFSAVWHRLCTRNRWYVCKYIVWKWGRSTAGSLISSLRCAPDRICSSAPPAGHHATRPWCSDAEHRGEGGVSPEVRIRNDWWLIGVSYISSHLGTDRHWPWHTGISMTVVQLSTVTFMLLIFGTQLWLPGVRGKMSASACKSSRHFPLCFEFLNAIKSNVI